MGDHVQPPARLLEQITAQQAHIADLERALIAAERAVRVAEAATAGDRAHHRADAALMALEAAETVLDRLLHDHASAVVRLLPRPRRSPAGGVEQAPLFDLR